MQRSEMRRICEQYIAQGTTAVPEHVSKEIIAAYGVQVPRGGVVKTPDEAVAMAEQVGFPVVLKAVSGEILHKTELQGVVLNITSADDLRQHCERMRQSFADAANPLEGLLVESMVASEAEFIVGLQDDPCFGPVIMLGTGGVMVHLMDDVTFRVLPLERRDVEEMIEEIRGKMLIRGFRGQAPLDEEALVQTLVAIGRFGMDASGLYTSVDFNPVVLSASGAAAVDAKIILAAAAAETTISAVRADTTNMDKFFQPRNVALIGASTTPGKIGNAVADSLINHDFQGKVFPITRGGKKVFGLDSYESIQEIPEKVDLAVVVVGLGLVPQILEHCRELEIPAVLIVSGGGKELGGEQAALEKEIQEKSRAYGIRVIGPNCIGCFSAQNRFDAFFQVHERMVRPKPGKRFLYHPKRHLRGKLS